MKPTRPARLFVGPVPSPYRARVAETTGQVCYVSGGTSADQLAVGAKLQSLGLSVLSSTDIGPSAKTRTEAVRDLVHRADLVVLFLEPNTSYTTLFEAGLAVGLAKRLLLITDPSIDVPFDLASVPRVRAKATDIEALEYAVRQILRAPRRRKGKTGLRRAPKLNDTADSLVARAARGDEPPERIVGEALTRAGVVWVRPDRLSDLGDFAVWADELDPVVGNPVFVEVKYASQPGHFEDPSAFRERVARGGALFGLVLYAGVTAGRVRWSYALGGVARPTIAAMSLIGFVEALREKSFSQLVSELAIDHATGEH
jgi:hypothetical protein